MNSLQAIWNRASLLVLFAAVSAVAVVGADNLAADAGGTVTVGIDGHCRIGHWTRVQYLGPQSVSAIETRDGDGVRVVYRFPSGTPSGYVIPGSEAAPLVLRDGDQEILSTRFPTVGSPGRGAAMIARRMRWVVVLGDPLGIDSIGANRLLDRDAKIAVTQPATPASLPDSALGYDGVDMVVINAAGAELLGKLGDEQQTALRDWIVDGGFVFLTLGQSTEQLASAAPWLIDLIPLDEPEMVRLHPSALETFTSTQTPLDPFRGVRLPKDQGRAIIRGRTISRISTPLAVEYNVGFGRIVVLAADLEQEMFARWPERLALVTQLTDSLLVLESTTEHSGSRSTAYDDLAGQLRASLDQFSSRRNFGFSFVSLCLMALIALIGPLDYLLVNRLLGRPLLGWFSFPVVIVGFCAVLVMQSGQLVSRSSASGLASNGTPRDVVPNDQAPAIHAPAVESTNAESTNVESTNVESTNVESTNVESTNVESTNVEGRAGHPQRTLAEVETNQLEIFDIDTIEHVGRGLSVRYFYSHDARRMNVDVTAGKSVDLISDRVQSLITAPFGHPGPAFGGIPISIEDARLPKYDLQFQSSGRFTSNQLVGLPLASRSSKGIFSRCRFTSALPLAVALERRPGSELLQGTLTNPLPFDLLDGVLVFRNWAYLLPTRFPPGGQVRSVSDLRQKNFRWRLSHQQALEESKTETEPWDPTDLDSLDRLAEMLMFYDAVGGTRYTSLRNDPLASLDLTDVLASDRCMLIGRLAEPLTSCQINMERLDPPAAVDQHLHRSLTLIRVVLPVQDRLRR